MYSKIYDFCKVRNEGSIFKNDPEIPTNRVIFLLNLLKSESIDYELDIFPFKETSAYNIILKGTSSKMVVAHHDIVNPKTDNANDNSCSVINAIMIKKLMPEINVVILDGEEYGGIGSQRVSNQIKFGKFGKIDWVLNLELTGRGGKNFFVGNYPGVLQSHIINLFNCPIVDTPFNDSVIFRRNGIDSCVINPLPVLEEGKESKIKYGDSFLDYSLLFNCHTHKDTLDTISPDDMREFVEEVVLKILE
jgi:hypothetical protein